MSCDLRHDLCLLSSLLSECSRAIAAKSSGNASDEDCTDIASIHAVIDDLMKTIDDDDRAVVQSSHHVAFIPLAAWISASPSLQETTHSHPLDDMESLKTLLHNTFCLWWMLLRMTDGHRRMVGNSNASSNSNSNVVDITTDSRPTYEYVNIDQMNNYIQFIFNYHIAVLQYVMQCHVER